MPTYTSTSSAHQQSRSGEIGKPEGTKKLKAPPSLPIETIGHGVKRGRAAGIPLPVRTLATGPKLPVTQCHMIPAIIEVRTVVRYGTPFMYRVWFGFHNAHLFSNTRARRLFMNYQALMKLPQAKTEGNYPIDCKDIHTVRWYHGSTEAGVGSLILYSHIVAARPRVTTGPRNLPDLEYNHFRWTRKKVAAGTVKQGTLINKGALMNVFCGVDKLTISRAAVARQIGLTPSAVSKPVSRARLDALSEEVAAFVLNDKEGGQGFRKED